jgi:hypothetical protein
MRTFYALSLYAITCSASTVPSAVDATSELIKTNKLAESQVKETIENAAEVRAVVVAREARLSDLKLAMLHLVLNKQQKLERQKVLSDNWTKQYKRFLQEHYRGSKNGQKITEIIKDLNK